MSTNNEKYLVLRGKNRDIYFIQKRLSKSQANALGKDFIKKSLETTDLNEAIIKRDKILAELDQLALNTQNKDNSIDALHKAFGSDIRANPTFTTLNKWKKTPPGVRLPFGAAINDSVYVARCTA